jgi:hypothetical protein
LAYNKVYNENTNISVMELPAQTKRLKEIIDFIADGNVSEFSRVIGVAQQKVNRIFNVDRRTEKKYPEISTEIIFAIASKLPNIDMTWFLTGKGEMVSSTDDNQLNLLDNSNPILNRKGDEWRIIELLVQEIASDRARIKGENPNDVLRELYSKIALIINVDKHA